MRTINLELILELPEHLEDGNTTYWAGLLQDLIDNRWKQSTFTKITVKVPPTMELWEKLPDEVKKSLIEDEAECIGDDPQGTAIDWFESMTDDELRFAYSHIIDFDTMKLKSQEESKDSG